VEPHEAIATLEERLEAPGAEPALFYLYGRLLQAEGRLRTATRAFAESIRRDPVLAPWSRLRLAELVVASDHPETAAGLLVSLLGSQTPPSVRAEAADLLSRVLSHGGDCELLQRVITLELPAAERARALLAEGRCQARKGNLTAARRHLGAALMEAGDHRVESEAVHDLLALDASSLSAPMALQLAAALVRLGRVRSAEQTLATIAASPTGEQDATAAEIALLTGRIRLQQGDALGAAAIFRGLSTAAPRVPSRRARAAYLEGLALETAGRSVAARGAYARAAGHEPTGRWAGPALFSVLRLVHASGDEPESRRILDLLSSYPQRDSFAARGAFLLAADDLAGGHADHVTSWLLAAHRHRAEPDELRYWEGRADLARGRIAAAADHFVGLLGPRPWHPITQDARDRLRDLLSHPALEERLDRWLASPRVEDRIAAWSVLPVGDPRRERAERSIYQRLTADPRWSSFLSLAPVPATAWPLWDRPLTDPRDRLLALGRWDETPWAHVAERFPPTEPALTYTAARRLAAANAIGASVRLAELLVDQARRAVPPTLLPLPLRHLLVPLPERDTVVAAARRHGADPALLAALLRQASLAAAGPGDTAGVGRRDDLAAAPAAVLSPHEGWGDQAEELAARLSGLASEMATDDPLALALAWTVGVTRARAWTGSAAGRDVPARLARIGETRSRAFVEAVLTDLAAYRSLYPELAETNGAE
jgi:tetratricopeptide (TPR) repeat protein